MLELSVRGQQETSNALNMMLEAVKQMAVTAEQASTTAQEARAEAQAAVSEVREIAEEFVTRFGCSQLKVTSCTMR